MKTQCQKPAKCPSFVEYSSPRQSW